MGGGRASPPRVGPPVVGEQVLEHHATALAHEQHAPPVGEPIARDRATPADRRLPTLASASLEPMSSEALLSRLRLMGATMLAIFATSVLFGATLNAGFSWYNAYASIGSAALIGLPIFAFELFFVNSPLGAGFRRWRFSRFVAVRCAVWSAWILCRDAALSPLVLEHRRRTVGGCRVLVDHPVLLRHRVLRRLGSDLESSDRTRRVAQLAARALSRAQGEQRALLFIDLVGSTAIAERIGATRFLALMNRFVYDIGTALEGSGGVIYRYVGDEASITWRLDGTRDLSDAVEVVFRLRARIAARGAEYRSHFGVLPDYRAALHAGPVVTGEMGDSKLEIVLLGDTVNTTARIAQSCREFDRAFLVSAEALALTDLPDGTESECMLLAPLKGKSRQVRLYAVDRAAPAEPDER